MRFYKGDGSFKAVEDSSFGWWLHDVFESENLIDCNSKFGENHNEIEDTINLDFSGRTKQLSIRKYEPSVKIQPYFSAQETQTDPEQCTKSAEVMDRIKQNFTLETEKFRSIKERLPDMVSADTMKGRLLMSIVDFPKYKSLTSKIEPDDSIITNQQISETEEPAVFLNSPFISCKLEELNNSTVWDFLNFKNQLFKRRLSLMEEISSKGCKNGKKYYAQGENVKNGCLKVPEKLHCLQSDCLKLSATIAFRERFQECAQLLYRNLHELHTKIYEMRQELFDIKIDFQNEDKRSANLLREFRKLSKELKESNYLNEILLLLTGRTDKVKLNNWPFKMCSNQDTDLNLII